MLDLKEMIQKYLEHCQVRKRLDSKTIKAYRIDLLQFEQLVGVEENPLVKENLMIYINYVHKNYKPKTIKRKIASVKAFIHYLEFDEIIEQNPFHKLDIKFREPQYLPKVVPLHTINEILKKLYEEKRLAKSNYQKKAVLRDITVIEMLFATGARISELCNLKPEQVDLKNSSILIYGKGAKERLIQVGNANVINIIKEYVDVFDSDIKQSNWFYVNRLGNRLSEQSVRFMLNKYVNLAGISMHITPHMFRHSFATLLLEADVDIRYIQKMLGHSSIVTTQIYTSVAIEKQKQILIEKHPRNLIAI